MEELEEKCKVTVMEQKQAGHHSFVHVCHSSSSWDVCAHTQFGATLVSIDSLLGYGNRLTLSEPAGGAACLLKLPTRSDCDELLFLIFCFNSQNCLSGFLFPLWILFEIHKGSMAAEISPASGALAETRWPAER